MKKEKLGLFYGFTVAEILISMAIAMVLATALVPVFGTKKVKNPRPRIQHGLAACYYDANGNVNFEQYSAGSAGHATEGVKTDSTCTIEIPKASHVEIIAVGGGGSATSYDFEMQVAPGSNQASGSLRVNNSFQDDINSAASRDSDLPKKIKETLNEWSQRYQNEVFAGYDITSPIGAGGSGKCKAVYANESCSAINSSGSWYPAREGYPTDNYTTDCWWYQHGRGGSSAPGIRVSNIAIPINGTSAITVEETTNRAGVSINSSGLPSSYVSLSPSGAGGDPQWRTDRGKGYYVTGTDSNVLSRCTYSGRGNLCSYQATVSGSAGGDGGIEQVLAQKCTDKTVSAKSGVVNYKGKGLDNSWSNNAAFTWQYNTLAVRPKFAEKGNYGKEVTQTFENLDGLIELHPGNAGGGQSYVIRKSDNQRIINAEGGGNGGIYDKNDSFDVKEQIPSEIAAIGKADNANHFSYLSKVKGSGFNLSTSNLIRCGNRCPGYAGTGTYLFVRKSNSDPSLNYLRIMNNQSTTSTSSGTYFGGRTYTKYFSTTSSDFKKYQTCPDGDIEVFLPQSWASYCIGSQQRGIGGAIIVIW